MESGRIVPAHSNQPQVTPSQSKDGEEAFNDMTKTQGYNKEALEKAVAEKTRLTRNKRAERKSKAQASIFLVDDQDVEEQAVYRTVMVDGILFTLRLLAVA